MNAKEHAEIWRKAAQVVAGLNTMWAGMGNIQFEAGLYPARMHSQEEESENRAYSAAAAVLNVIAAEYEAAAKALTE